MADKAEADFSGTPHHMIIGGVEMPRIPPNIPNYTEMLPDETKNSIHFAGWICFDDRCCDLRMRHQVLH